MNYSLDDPHIRLTPLRILHPSRQISRSIGILAIIPLVQSDNDLLTTMRTILKMDDRWGAAYVQNQHFILLKTWLHAGEFARGISLLHEAGHALAAYQENRMFTSRVISPAMEIPEETEQHYMEAELWKERGGQAYRDILDRAVYRVSKLLKGRIIYRSLPRYNPWLVTLNSFLGETTDEDTLSDRVGSFSLFAHFEYYERNARKLPGTVQQCRMEAIKAIHQKIWALRESRRTSGGSSP